MKIRCMEAPLFIHICMTLAGIDYSLCSPCICIFDGTSEEKFTIDKCSFYFLTDVKKLATVYDGYIFGEMLDAYNHDCHRYETISDWAVDHTLGCSDIGLEGYAYGATGRAVFQIAENCGLLKYKLYQVGKPVEIITPSVVKKWGTGKGNATKEKMVEAFKLDTKIDLVSLVTPDRKTIGNPVTDIADSYFICSYLHNLLREHDHL